MENLKDLYEELERDALKQISSSTKADRIRLFTQNLSDYIGKSRLCLDSVFNLAHPRIQCDKPITKSYFKSIISKTWEIEVDDIGILWILVDQPKKRRRK